MAFELPTLIAVVVVGGALGGGSVAALLGGGDSGVRLTGCSSIAARGDEESERAEDVSVRSHGA